MMSRQKRHFLIFIGVLAILFLWCVTCQGQDRAAEILRKIREQKPTQPAYTYTPADVIDLPSENNDRLPRCIMITSATCLPCEKMKSENKDLIGPEKISPVQVIDEREDWQQYGIPPSMVIAVPAFFILDKHGELHTITGSNGQPTPCRRTGYMSSAELKAYLSATDHGVSLEALPQGVVSSRHGCAFLSVVGGTADCLPAALAMHMCSVAGEPKNLAGGLFDVDVDVPDSIPEILHQLVTDRVISQSSLGVSITLPPETSIDVKVATIRFSKPLQITYRTGIVTIHANLDAIKVSDDGREITLELSGQGKLGVPDLTVRLL